MKILQELDAPVKLTVYSRETDRPVPRSARRVRVSIRQQSHRRVRGRRSPAGRPPAQIQSYGTIVIEYKDKTERVTANDEQAITNGIIKAMTGAARKVYFTQGHGEKDTTGTDRLATPRLPARSRAITTASSWCSGSAGARRCDGGDHRRTAR